MTIGVLRSKIRLEGVAFFFNKAVESVGKNLEI